jgi:ABC-2 type transport system ATP-binding protein
MSMATIAGTTTSHASASRADRDAALDLRGVSKVYRGKLHALRDVDMTVQRGTVFGLLGPNGAGKSTLVKIMLKIIQPTTAQGTILGHQIGDRNVLRRIGYLPEHHRFPDYLTARQVVEHTAMMTGVPMAESKRRTPELLELVGLRGWESQKVGRFSKGMRQRVGLAQALVNKPDLIVLDEPTDGVDPIGRKEIREIIHRLKDEGQTVFLNSHLLSELEMVCDHVAILVHGKVARHGTIDALTRDHRGYRIVVGVDDHPADAHAALALARRIATSIPFRATDAGTPGPATPAPAENGVLAGRLITHDVPVSIIGPEIAVGTDDPTAVQPLIDGLRRAGHTIRQVQQTRPSLEDLFMSAVQEEGGDASRPLGASTKARRASR